MPTKTNPVTVSRHMLRRTARKREQHLERTYPEADFRVVSTVRGPFGWRVEQTAGRSLA